MDDDLHTYLPFLNRIVLFSEVKQKWSLFFLFIHLLISQYNLQPKLYCMYTPVESM